MKPLIILVIVILTAASPVFAQNKKAQTAAARTAKAVEVVRQFAALGADSVPVANLRKAKAIAVFPELTRVNFLIEELSVGNGLVSIRSEDEKWGVPAFLAFKGVTINLKLFEKKSYDTVVLFMDDESIGWLKKGDINLNGGGKKKIALGPVIDGKETDKTMENAHLIYYTFENGQLVDTDFKNDTIFKSFAIVHDNNLTKAIFGMKTRQLFAAPETGVTVPVEIESFRAVLTETLKDAAVRQIISGDGAGVK
jgi:lipid-binding SYLF domain-containing protein